MMGFAYGLGGAISPLVGRLADSFSIRPVLTVMAVIPLLVVPVILKFPAVKSSG
jgi:FSR family fosmidomycin resistance protein-like MFS transporter